MFEYDEPERMQAPESGSELDELIRASIATYGEPAPNSELAQRILVRITREPRPAASQQWLPWAVAVPIAACLIAAFALFELRSVHAPTSLADHARVTGQITNERSTANIAPAVPYQSQRENRTRLTRNEARPHFTTVAAKAQSLPKLEVFPMPQSLSPAEQALIAFASRAPAAERKAFVEAQQDPDAPLAIAAIKIQPIELPELGMN